jgi:hypothetical protein
MKKTMMYLPDDMHRFLAEEAERRGVSMAEVAREAIAEYRARSLEAPARSHTAIVGVIDAPRGVSDDADRVDELLAAHFARGGDWEQENGLADAD